LDQAVLELRDFGHAFSPTGTGVKVAGGPLLAAHRAAAGKTNIFSGASAGNFLSYDVSNGGRLLVRDMWYEQGAAAGVARIHGTAVFTMDGARISSPIDKTPAAFTITDLKGRAAVIATHLDDRIVITGSGHAAEVLGLAIFDQARGAGYFVNGSTPAAPAILVNSRHRAQTGDRSVATPNVGTVDAALLEKLLSHTRGEMPGLLRTLPRGVTDVRMFRVWVVNGINNVTALP
jgi:hypothetical protein